MGLNPSYRFDWLLENVLVVACLTLMYFIHRRHPFSLPAYTSIFIFLVLHTIGAHYTYSQVPFTAVTNFFGWQRNHYDRVVHFSFGLLLTQPVFEILSIRIKTRQNMKYFLTFCVILTCGIIYELLEWLTAIVVEPTAGNAFLGAQGDAWDAQKDLTLKMTGSLLAVFIAKFKKRRS